MSVLLIDWGAGPSLYLPGTVRAWGAGAGAARGVAPDLLTALWDLLASSTQLEEEVGRSAGGENGYLRKWIASSRVPEPIVVLSATDSDSPTFTTAGSSLRTVSVLIVAYALSPDQAESIAQAIRAVLEPIPGYDRLVFVNGEELSRVPGDSGVPTLDPNRSALGGQVWSYRVPIDFLIDRSS